MTRRLLISIFFALVAHLVLLQLKIAGHTKIVQPEPLAVRSISVSLGCRPAFERHHERIPAAKVAVQEPEPVNAGPGVPSASARTPRPAVNKKPAPRITRPTVHKVKVTETVKKQGAVAKPADREVRPNPPSQPEPETEENQERSRTAARIIQEARPLYKLNPPPKYPRLARRRGYEGLVVLEVGVDEYGRPVTVSLSAGSGYSILDKAALEAVRKWRFQPGIIAGFPQKMTIRVPVRFRLDD